MQALYGMVAPSIAVFSKACILEYFEWQLLVKLFF